MSKSVVLGRKTPTILWKIEDDGRTDKKLIATLEAKGIKLGDYEKHIIAKANEPIPPTGTVYWLVGIEGIDFPMSAAERTTKNIFAEASRRNYGKPPFRAALLLREKFSQRQISHSSVAVMSEPIHDSAHNLSIILGLREFDADRDQLQAWNAHPENLWDCTILFVFLAPPELQS